MIITDIQIKNYKSILDSNKIHLEDKLTILIGKNESGKSNLLQAIRDINCLQDNVKIYPYHNRDYPPQITLNVLLTEKEKSFFLNKYGVNISVAVIYIEIGDKFSVELERDIWDEIEKPFINDFKNQTGVDIHFNSEQADDENIVSECGEENKQAYIGLYNEMREAKNKKTNELCEDITKLLPKIKYLSTMDNVLPEKIETTNLSSVPVKLLAQFIKKQSLGKFDDAIFQKILECPDSQERKRLCDNVSKVLTRFFEENYKQYELKFDLTPDSNKIDIYVKDYFKENQDDGMGLYLDQRSTGLNWFVSFVITCNSFDDNEIFVLDEPGMYLHLEGQQNMLSLLKRLSNERQIIICTHSPYLIDPDMIPIVRLVEKVDSSLDSQSFSETKVYKNLHSFKDNDTIQTLCDAIGYNIHKGLSYHSDKALIVEGISDLLLLKAYAKIIQKSLDYDIFFAKSSSKMDIMYALLSGLGIKKIVALFDKDRDGAKAYGEMPYIQDYAVFTHEITEQEKLFPAKIINKMSIEDILSKEDFKKYYLNGDEKFAKLTLSNSEIAKNKNSKYLDSKMLLDKIDECDFSAESKKEIKRLFDAIDDKFALYEN